MFTALLKGCRWVCAAVVVFGPAKAIAQTYHGPLVMPYNRPAPPKKVQAKVKKPAKSKVVTTALPPPRKALPPPYMELTSTPISPPYGFTEFCSRPHTSDICNPYNLTEDQLISRFNATAENLASADAINREVNAAYKPLTDSQNYGIPELWTYPANGSADCEDYALEKQRRLIAAGWPANAVLLTVVQVNYPDQPPEAHAVLTLRTTHGDYIADNRQDELKLWHQTTPEYTFSMRQSFVNPQAWVALTKDVPSQTGN